MSNFAVSYNKKGDTLPKSSPLGEGIMKGLSMNLHEECLLKYLLNPKGLFTSTELLKLNNELLEKGDLKIISTKLHYGATI